MLFRWAWAMALAAVLLLGGYNVWLFAHLHMVPVADSGTAQPGLLLLSRAHRSSRKAALILLSQLDREHSTIPNHHIPVELRVNREC